METKGTILSLVVKWGPLGSVVRPQRKTGRGDINTELEIWRLRAELGLDVGVPQRAWPQFNSAMGTPQRR